MGLYGLCRVDSGQQVVRQYHKHRVGSMQRALQSVQSGWCAARCVMLWSVPKEGGVTVSTEWVVCSKQGSSHAVQSGWCATRCGTLESLVSVYLVASGGRYSQ